MWPRRLQTLVRVHLSNLRRYPNSLPNTPPNAQNNQWPDVRAGKTGVAGLLPSLTCHRYASICVQNGGNLVQFRGCRHRYSGFRFHLTL
ncbi:hypothetical protein MARPO_0017s0015 [Marchantia polymorpha]|uniref:Uncharacterized protein n=1 Tax=Marchantia polymorpha TaxID=3197 RepID=A0A2R6XFK3_MARPO|nr:hypothetical protein MARPO_0017s0015 [Marchantia polymorpha]|eukprot:PTQ44890.1 hypothetical protein MARPO_0017s0015 [Marchantia polymorpha]